MRVSGFDRFATEVSFAICARYLLCARIMRFLRIASGAIFRFGLLQRR